jgi:hypothetical protein
LHPGRQFERTPVVQTLCDQLERLGGDAVAARRARVTVEVGDRVRRRGDGLGPETEIVGLVAKRVRPGVTLGFGHRQPGVLEVSARCTGCRTAFGTLLRVPTGDMITPEVTEHLAGRIAELVNERHCELIAADVEGVSGRATGAELPPFDGGELRQFEGTDELPVEGPGSMGCVRRS